MLNLIRRLPVTDKLRAASFSSRGLESTWTNLNCPILPVPFSIFNFLQIDCLYFRRI